MAGATPHGHHQSHYTPFSLSRFAKFMGFRQPNPPQQDFDAEWVAVPPVNSASSSFVGGQGTATSAPDDTRAPLTPYLLSSNPFGRAHATTTSNVQWGFPANSTAPGSTYGSPISPGTSSTLPIAKSRMVPTLTVDPLASFRLSSQLSSPNQKSPPKPTLTNRLKNSGLFPVTAPSSPALRPSPNKGKLHISSPITDGGIGESPSLSRSGSASKGKGKAVEKGKEREVVDMIKRKEKDRLSSYDVGAIRNSKRVSPHSLSPLLNFGSTPHQSPMIGRAMGVRTSLLGFGSSDPALLWDHGQQTLEDEPFGNPRKAPLPPGATSSSASSAVVSDESPVQPAASQSMHIRKHSEGGSITLAPVREASGESDAVQQTRAPIGEDLEVNDTRDHHFVVTPPPHAHSGDVAGPSSPAIQPSQVPLPPSSAYSSDTPSTISPISPMYRSQTGHTPSQSQSTTNKPPVPPKSAAMLLRAHRTIKASTSTPDLAGQARAKGKEKERPEDIRTGSAAQRGIQPSPSAPPSGGKPFHFGPAHMLQAQTICDAFMFPKPRFVAHVISPPDTPEIGGRPEDWPPQAPPSSAPPTLPPLPLPPAPITLEKAIEDGITRDRERNEWAKAAKGHGSSLVRGMSISMRSSNSGRTDQHLSVASGSGIVNRLRSRTLSGIRRHTRGGSKDTNASSTGPPRATPKALKNQRSLDFLMAEKQAASGATGVESPTPSRPGTAGGGPGRQGKLSISLPRSSVPSDKEKPSFVTGTVSTMRSSHSRKSSRDTGSAAQVHQHRPALYHPFGTHSRTGSGSGSHGAVSMASTALRKVKSLCGPDDLSPAEDMTSFTAHQRMGLREVNRLDPVRGSLYEDDIFNALGNQSVLDISGPPVHRRQSTVHENDEELEEEQQPTPKPPAEEDEDEDSDIASFTEDYIVDGDDSGRDSAAAQQLSHSSTPATLEPQPLRASVTGSSPVDDSTASHLDMEDAEEETGIIQHVTRRVSVSAGHVVSPTIRQSTVSPPIDIQRNDQPVPTPSPSPSSYNGIYGIALGTPSQLHPFANLDDEDDEAQEVAALPAGPHPLSPTYLQIPMSDIAARHRFPHRPPQGPPPSASLPSIPGAITPEAATMYGSVVEGPSSVIPVYARSSFTTVSSPRSSNIHPFAAPTSPTRHGRVSVSSVEAMFGGELLESSHIVSPLGVREAGTTWINSSQAHELEPPATIYEDMPFQSAPSSRPESTADVSAFSFKSRPFRAARSRAMTLSSTASMLIESPPPSVFPSFRQDRFSGKFDTMTFGPGDDLSLMDAERPPAEEPQSPTFANVPESPSSSVTSSIEGPPKPIGSSDDLESFKDLFYVPRSRQPSGGTIRRAEGSEHRSSGVTEAEEPASVDARSKISSNRILSPLSSVMPIRQSFPDGDTSTPYRFAPINDASPIDAAINGYFPPRNSVYDIIEENESIRSSVERLTEEDVHVGMITVLSPNRTEHQHNRYSTQLSLHEADDYTFGPDRSLVIPRQASFLSARVPVSPMGLRTSYLTSTSATSFEGGRMSTIISDFPNPPANEHNLAPDMLEYYGVSPAESPSDPSTPATHTIPLSFSPTTPDLPVQHRPSLPFRSDSFGPP